MGIFLKMKFAAACIIATIAAATESFGYSGARSNGPAGIYNTPRSNGPVGGYNSARSNFGYDGYNSARSNGPAEGYNSARSNGPAGIYNTPRSNGPVGGYSLPRSNGGYGIPGLDSPLGSIDGLGAKGLVDQGTSGLGQGLVGLDFGQTSGVDIGGFGGYGGQELDIGRGIGPARGDISSLDVVGGIKGISSGKPYFELKGFRGQGPKVDGFRGKGPKDLKGFRGQGPKELKGFRGQGPKGGLKGFEAGISGLKGFDSARGFDYSQDYSNDTSKLGLNRSFRGLDSFEITDRNDSLERSGVRDFGDIDGIKGLDKKEAGDKKDLGGLAGRGNLKTDAEIGGLDGLNGIDGQNQSKKCFGPECGEKYYQAPVHKPLQFEQKPDKAPKVPRHESPYQPSYGYQQPSYAPVKPVEKKQPSYGYEQPSYAPAKPVEKKQPSYGYEQPSYGGYEQPSYGGYEQPSYGYEQPKYERRARRSYKAPEPKKQRSYGYEEPSYGGYQQPSYGRQSYY